MYSLHEPTDSQPSVQRFFISAQGNGFERSGRPHPPAKLEMCRTRDIWPLVYMGGGRREDDLDKTLAQHTQCSRAPYPPPTWPSSYLLHACHHSQRLGLLSCHLQAKPLCLVCSHDHYSYTQPTSLPPLLHGPPSCPAPFSRGVQSHQDVESLWPSSTLPCHRML